jgi:hypothetical protein
LAVLSVLATLVLAELGARAVFWVRWGKLYPLQVMRYSLRLGWQLAPGQYRDFRINSYGFRESEETSVRKPPGRARFLLAGGSTAFGTQGLYPDFPSEPLREKTIDYYLEELLADQLSDVEVLNAGVPEYRLAQEIVLWREKLIRFDPDLVIFLDGHNDFAFLSNLATDTSAAPLWNSRHILRGESALNARSPLGVFRYADIYLGRTSYAYYGLSQLMQGVVDRAEPRANPWGTVPFDPANEDSLRARWAGQVESVATEYTNLVADLASMAKRRNRPVLYVIQPEIMNEDSLHLTALERRIQARAFAHHRDRGTFVWRYLGSTLPQRLAALRSGCFEIADLGRIADGSLQVYTDYTHLTPEGNRRVAQRLLPFVLSMVSRRPSCDGPS